jgi:malonyl-CoA decarboxylase
MNIAKPEISADGPVDDTGPDQQRHLHTLARLSSSFSSSGRKLLQRLLPSLDRHFQDRSPNRTRTALDLATALLSVRGEASSVAIASDLLDLYQQMDMAARETFLLMLAKDFDPDEAALIRSWELYRRDGPQALPDLSRAVEAPRQELFRRLNFAPGGTAALVRMRSDLLSFKDKDREFDRVDADLRHLLQSWFNRGFLSMQPIDWSSPASLLARLIQYESVHDINSWAELRLRVEPQDRRCFAFFHPAMPEEPLIFVEVALTSGIPDNIQDLLTEDRQSIDPGAATTATFYSINNCQAGLTGISFGHFLIKQVAADLKRDWPNLNCFVTLSPVPTLMRWLRKGDNTADEKALIAKLDNPAGFAEIDDETARLFMLRRALDYFAHARNPAGKPYDPVSRFHLGNGARLEQVNWRADTSANGLRQSGSVMVNYLYDLTNLEENHEAFVERGAVVTGTPFKRLATALAAHDR